MSIGMTTSDITVLEEADSYSETQNNTQMFRSDVDLPVGHACLK